MGFSLHGGGEKFAAVRTCATSPHVLCRFFPTIIRLPAKMPFGGSCNTAFDGICRSVNGTSRYCSDQCPACCPGQCRTFGCAAGRLPASPTLFLLGFSGGCLGHYFVSLAIFAALSISHILPQELDGYFARLTGGRVQDISRRITVRSMRAACILLILACTAISCNQQETELTTLPQVRQQTTAPARSTLERSFFLKHHFGVVDAGVRLSHSLELKNETDTPIRFGFSSTTCGSCLFVISMPEEVLPGETGIFELEFDTTGRRGETPQQALFWDAEPRTLLVLADVSATVKAVWTNPETINLGNLSTSDSQQTRLHVLAAGLPDAEVTLVQSEAPWLTVTSQPVETSRALSSQNVRAIDSYEIVCLEYKCSVEPQ